MGWGEGRDKGVNGPSNNSEGGPGPPIFPHAYATLDAVVQTLCDAFNKQASFKTMLSEVHKLVLLYLTVPVTTANSYKHCWLEKNIEGCNSKNVFAKVICFQNIFILLGEFSSNS